MTTKEMIEWLLDVNVHKKRVGIYLRDDSKIVEEIIRRLEELEELRVKLKNVRMKVYVDQAFIDELLKA